jgi:hypothetical protein
MFPHKNPVCTYFVSRTCYMSRPSHLVRSTEHKPPRHVATHLNLVPNYECVQLHPLTTHIFALWYFSWNTLLLKANILQSVSQSIRYRARPFSALS